MHTIELRMLVVLGALAVVPGRALGGDTADVDHSFVWGAGPAAERNMKDRSTAYGVATAVETTPIEHWLELEFGVTLLNTANRTQVEADLLFKKPFRLNQTAELMIGMGPSVARRAHSNDGGTSFGMEFVLDFMFWPAKNVGWYLEPGYGFGIGRSRGERSISGSAGILVGWQ